MSKKRKAKSISMIVALVIAFACIGSIGTFYGTNFYKDHKVKKLGEDLVALHNENPDLVGWIKVDGTNISYPVMRGEKYLRKNVKGEYDISGTPFVDDDWNENFNSTVIYGHNMKYYGTMFAKLDKYKDKDFQNKYPTFTYYTINEQDPDNITFNKETYYVFSAAKTTIKDWAYYAGELDEDTLEEYIENAYNKALYSPDSLLDIVGENTKIMTLSTCSYHVPGKNGRFVVVGEHIDIKENVRYVE